MLIIFVASGFEIDGEGLNVVFVSNVMTHLAFR